MKKFALLALLAMSPMIYAAESMKPMMSASAPASPLSQLKQACISKLKPALKRGERVRSIADDQGQVDRDIVFTVGANSEDNKQQVFVCSVQKDGSLKMMSKGFISKGNKS